MEKATVMKDLGVNSGSSRKGKPKGKTGIRRIDIEKADNGGFIVGVSLHSPMDGPYVEPTRHVFKGKDDMLTKLASLFKD